MSALEAYKSYVRTWRDPKYDNDRAHIDLVRNMLSVADAAIAELEAENEYIHQLEGWLAEVRERSASLLEERNELRKAMRTLGNDYNALSAEHAKWQEEARSYCQNASYHRQKREQAEAEVSRLQVHEDESAERLERLTEAVAELAALKGRRCSACTHSADGCPVSDAAWTTFGVVPFNCCCWAERGTE